MPILTDHLRDEISVIRVGVDQLDSLLSKITEGAPADVEGLRMVVFSLRLLFKRNFVLKLETVLYPALSEALDATSEANLFNEGAEITLNTQAQFRLMRLQLILDSMGGRFSPPDNLAQCIEECLESIRRILALTENLVLPLADRHLTSQAQQAVYSKVREIDSRSANERVQATQLLLNYGAAHAAPP